MIYAVEAWTYPWSQDGGAEEMVESRDFSDIDQARKWAWERLEEGYAVLMWRR